MKVGQLLNMLREGTHYYIYDNGILNYEGDINSKADYTTNDPWEWECYKDIDVIEIKPDSYNEHDIEIYV